MGWDAGLNRRLAVPLAFGACAPRNGNVLKRIRILKEEHEDLEEIEVFRKIAENRQRLEKLREEVDADCDFVCDDDIATELDYLNASIQLELLEVTGELEEIPCSEEVFVETAAEA